MKALILALLVLVVPVASADTYVHVAAQPDFQYRSDEDVSVPFQVMLIQDDVPQGDDVSVRVQTRGGQSFPVRNEIQLAGGVQPYPSVQHIHFGRLDAGLYALQLVATSGRIEKHYVLDVSVVKPPKDYSATLDGKGREGRFSIDPSGNGPFTVTIFRDSGGSIQVLDSEVVLNATTLKVPYTLGAPTKVRVEDVNGWANYANRDFAQTSISYPDWVWYPDFKEAQNYKDRAPFEMILGGLVLAVLGAGVGYVLWKRRLP